MKYQQYDTVQILWHLPKFCIWYFIFFCETIHKIYFVYFHINYINFIELRIKYWNLLKYNKLQFVNILVSRTVFSCDPFFKGLYTGDLKQLLFEKHSCQPSIFCPLSIRSLPFQAIILIRHDSEYCDILSVFWGFSRGRWSLTEHLRAAGLGTAPPVCGQVFIKESFLSVGSLLSVLDPPHRSRPVHSTADLRERHREWKKKEAESGYIPLCLMCLSWIQIFSHT